MQAHDPVLFVDAYQELPDRRLVAHIFRGATVVRRDGGGRVSDRTFQPAVQPVLVRVDDLKFAWWAEAP